MELDSRLSLKEIIPCRNVAELLSQEDLDKIAQQVIEDYKRDLESRGDWEIKNAEALKLALQIVEMKTTPWPNCANVKFPLVTIAAMQGHAREYPALIYGTEIVKCRVVGNDPDGEKTARAYRVASHMSYQILEEDTNWENEMDRVILTKYIVGSAFKKIYYDPVLGHNVSDGVLAQHLVIPYNAKSIEKASRLTHVIPLSKNDIYERVARGTFLDIINPEVVPVPKEETELDIVSDTIQGQHSVLGDSDEPTITLEQHRYLDLDGDGYKEPYIVTVSEVDKKVLRIVARFYEDDITYGTNQNKERVVFHIRPNHYFVKYSMLPSPDGGIYDLGFGAMIGPLNHVVNTIFNQQLDASTMRALGAGFLGRGAKLRRGQNQFNPGEFKQTDSANIKNDVVLIPTPTPDMSALKLLEIVLAYSEKISGATDIMSGQNIGQNTPANTAMELVKQGSMIFNSIFKRTYRSLRDEFRMLYRLNQVFINQNKNFAELTNGKSAMIMKDDYKGPDTDIAPSADPNIASVEKRMQQAVFLKQASMQGPGYKALAIERRMLEAAQIPYLSEVWDENVPAQQDPKMLLEQQKLQLEAQRIQADTQYKMLTLLQEADKIRAEIIELHARAEQELAQAKGVESGQAVALIQAQIAERKNQMDGNLKAAQVTREILDSMVQLKGVTDGAKSVQTASQSGGTSGVATPSNNQGS